MGRVCEQAGVTRASADRPNTAELEGMQKSKRSCQHQPIRMHVLTEGVYIDNHLCRYHKPQVPRCHGIYHNRIDRSGRICHNPLACPGLDVLEGAVLLPIEVS